MQGSTHAKSCDILCACCLRKVNTVKSVCGGSEIIPDINDSQPLTAYICNLAAIRLQVT